MRLAWCKILQLTIALLMCGWLHAQPPYLVEPELSQSLKALKKGGSDTSYVNLLLKLSYHYVAKSGEEKKDLDSAILLAQRAEALSKTLHYDKGVCRSLYQYALAYREGGNGEKGKQYALQALSLSATARQYNTLGDIYTELSEYYTPWEDTARAEKIKLLLKADSAFMLAGSVKQQAFTRKNLGDLYQIDGQPKEALRSLKQALTLYQSIGYKDLQGIYDLLGYCYSVFFSDHQTGLKYALMAVKCAGEQRDTSPQLGTIYTRLGQIYAGLNENELAYRNFLMALDIFKKYKDTSNLYILAFEITTNLDVRMKHEEEYAFIKDIDKKYKVPGFLIPEHDAFLLKACTRLKRYKEAQQYAEAIKQREGSKSHHYSMINMIIYYISTAEYKKAEEWLGYFDVFRASHPASRVISQIWASRLRARLNEARGNYKDAVEYLKQLKDYSDTLFNTQKSNQVTALQIEFETERKDQDLKIKTQSIDLLTSQTKLQDEQIKQSAIMRNIIVAGVIILLVILALLYSRYRLKQRTNQEINNKNLALQRLVNEKEWLLKEIHHRVKNNLQTVVSLLESQSAYLQDDALHAIQDSQNRVHAMSLIHQKLYQTDNVAAINMATYLPELVNYLRNSFNTRQINFNLQIAPIALDVSQAIPVGLILNEAITNCIKYAFTQPGPDHTITITMQESGSTIQLTVADNGIGLPAGYKSRTGSSLGMKLMKGLTEDLEGAFNIHSNGGTEISIRFTANTPLTGKNEISSPAA